MSQSDEIDQQDSWTEQDQAEIANFSLQYAASLGLTNTGRWTACKRMF